MATAPNPPDRIIRQHLMQELRRLPRRTRTIVMLHEADGCNPAEIAAVIGHELTPGQIVHELNAALGQLRQAVARPI
jgi:DNA-directed RNA polymerase specialized sigma24 family protein